MKKSLLTSTLILLLSASTCFAIGFSKCIVGKSNPGTGSNSLKAWEDEWTMAQAGSVLIDIWVSDVPEPLITAGVLIEYDTSQMSIVSVTIDGAWDMGMSHMVKDPKGLPPGTLMITTGNLSSVHPDEDGDISVATIEFQCLVGSCDGGVMSFKTVPGFDSVVGTSSGVFDSDISPNYFYFDSPCTTTTTTGNFPTTTTTKDYICISETIYGSDSSETQLLRSIRDTVLSKTQEGRELIKLYYQWSPMIVRAMEADEEFKQEVKDMVDGVLGMVE